MAIMKKDLRRIYPIEIIWAKIRENRNVPIIFDEHANVIEAFTDYNIHIAKDQIQNNSISYASQQAYDSTVNSNAYALKSLAKFLRFKRIKWKDINDELLEKYRDWELINIRKKKSSRNEITAKRTVNKKLAIIYQFYAYMQFAGEITGHIGWGDYKINSICYDEIVNPSQIKNIRKKNKKLYPLMFRRTGSFNSNIAQHYATDEEVEALKSYFWKKYSDRPYIAFRNVIMIEILEDTGWRSNSLRSLRVEQFSDKVIEKAINNFNNSLKVVPTQKFGLKLIYDVSLELSAMINHFVKSARKEILSLKKISEAKDEGWLFMPTKSNRQLFGSRGISDIISRGFKKIDAPKGSGTHSIRRKRGKEFAKEIIERRIREGLSLDPKDIMEELKDRLGHTTYSAMGCYTLGKREIRAESIENKLRRQSLELKDKLNMQIMKNKNLTAKYTDLKHRYQGLQEILIKNGMIN